VSGDAPEPVVLDSWIVIAWLKDQPPGAQRMSSLWTQAARRVIRVLINVVNVGEIFYLTAKVKDVKAAEMVLENLRKRPVELVGAPEDLVMEAARLKARYPIAYGDAIAVATARRRGCRLATGDPELRRLEEDGVVELDWAG
jgi:ribonuclease VapC